MALQNPEQLKHLQNAFEAFNEMSDQLMLSYHQLEGQVDRLNRELAVAHGERIEQREQKQDLANRLESVLDALPAGVIVLNGKGIVQEANRVAIQLLAEPLKGQPWRKIIQKVFKPHPGDGHDISLRDGRIVSISTSSLEHEPGQIVLITDVSEKRRLEDKLGRYHRLSAMGQMAASLAHQIRTPAASALLYLSSLRRSENTPDAVEKYADKVHEQLCHIEAMVRDMLAYAKGEQASEANIFTPQELIDALKRAVQTQFNQADVALIIQSRESDLYLKGNREAFIGALINLVMNSLHAASDAPLRIEIHFTRYDANTLSITVKDNGVGIPIEIQETVFDPFVTTRPQGTGLGLAVVKSIVEKHGGQIKLESQQGRGTSITMRIPIYQTQAGGQANIDDAEKEVWL